MKFRIPFTFSSVDKLKKRADIFKRLVKPRKNSWLDSFFRKTSIELTREEFLAICLGGFFSIFVVIFVIISTIFVFLKIASSPFLASLILAFSFATFITFSRFVYPKVFDSRRQKDIENNLISALQDMHVQLSSGIPLFSILVNISSSDYGELSEEFKKIVRRINAGYGQIEVLEEIGEENTSLFFRRALWQISNGMRAGGDISIVIEESIKSLSEDQLVQIQNYGNKLNPTIMFYMLISVIIPALSITFLTVISSMVDLSRTIATIMFIGLFVFVMVIQVIFLGVIKSIRPSLL
jgi:archaeal flagellar protein FlaJ